MSDESQRLIEQQAQAGFREELQLWKSCAAAILAALGPEPQLDLLDQALAKMSPADRTLLVQACILAGRQARSHGLG